MNFADTSLEIKLRHPPKNLISSVKFGPSSDQFLLVSSWDAVLRLYDVKNNGIVALFKHENPILDCCFIDNDHAWCATLDCQVRAYDLEISSGSKGSLVGNHQGPVKCMEYCTDLNIVATGSWDSTVKFWDSQNNECIGIVNKPDKVYTMTICGNKLIVGTAGRKISILDMRKLDHPYQQHESSLKYQTRCIRAFPNKQGYVVGSIEGRVAVEYFDPNPEVQQKKYAFKCHRTKEDNMEYIYPVNAISFHNEYNTFATGGSDGFVNVWDGFNKKKLCQFHSYPTHISSLAFSPAGNILAIASSFIYEADVQEIPEDSIYIRKVTDRETKPKKENSFYFIHS